jgi:hypothetical protein
MPNHIFPRLTQQHIATSYSNTPIAIATPSSPDALLRAASRPTCKGDVTVYSPADDLQTLRAAQTM